LQQSPGTRRHCLGTHSKERNDVRIIGSAVEINPVADRHPCRVGIPGLGIGGKALQ
jgi:hypothetical protein